MSLFAAACVAAQIVCVGGFEAAVEVDAGLPT